MAHLDRTCWLVRPDPRSNHVRELVSRGIVSYGWDLPGVGDLRERSDADIFTALQAAGRPKPEEDLRRLRMFTDRIGDGDVIVLPEPAIADLVFGTVTGPYGYDPAGGEHRHARPVRWFGRLREDRAPDLLASHTRGRGTLLRRLPEQLHWDRLAGEVGDLLGRPVDDVPRRAVVVRGSSSRPRTPRAPAAPKPAPIPDRLCPSCGLLRAPSLFPDGDEYCRDCA